MTGRYLNNELSGLMITLAAEASETEEISFLKGDTAEIMIEYYYAKNYIQVFIFTQLPYMLLSLVYLRFSYWGLDESWVIGSIIILLIEIFFEIT
jgi:hypothetical protein